MRWVGPRFSLDLPVGFVEARPRGLDGDLRAVDRDAGVELVAASTCAAARIPAEQAAAALLGAKQRALRELDAAMTFTPIAVDVRGARRVHHVAGRGARASRVFVGVVAQRIGDEHVLVTLCLTSDGRIPTDAFAHAAARIIESIEAIASIDEGDDDDAGEGRRSLPFLVPADELTGSADAALHLGHGLYVALGDAREAPASLGDPRLEAARVRLAERVRAGAVPLAGLAGPGGLPVLQFGPDPLAASCMLLPDLLAFARTHLGGPPLVAYAPHRAALFVFRAEDAAYRRRVRAYAAAHAGEAGDPLSEGLFALDVATPGSLGVWPLADEEDDGRN